jgi:ribosomal protein S18 acetylase RimI-like enzyme
MAVKIIYPSNRYFKTYHEALSSVAKERIYIEMTEAPTLEKVSTFQGELIAKKGPVSYATDDEKVVGWCDIFPNSNPRMIHRGSLGMGIISEYRGKGIGSKLLESTLNQAKTFGLEKVELQVYTSNTAAIALYKKFGFEEEGIIKRYRKLDGNYFNALLMAKFL